MKNGVSVQTDLAEGLPLIQGDRVQLQQVILNLIINAIEAMSEIERRAAGIADQRRARPSRATCSSPCAIRARDWRRRLSSTSSRPSTRPSRTVWAWGCRSAVRSSKRMADDCGRAPMRPAAPSFNSPCPRIYQSVMFAIAGIFQSVKRSFQARRSSDIYQACSGLPNGRVAPGAVGVLSCRTACNCTLTSFADDSLRSLTSSPGAGRSTEPGAYLTVSFRSW